MDWKILSLTVPLLFVFYQAVAKLLPKDTSIFLVNAYASLVGFAFMALLHFLTQQNKSIQLGQKVFLYAIGIGLLVSLGNLGIIKAYSMGAPQSIFTVLFYVSLVIYGIIFGLLIWNEKFSFVQALGCVLACVGVCLVVLFKK